MPRRSTRVKKNAGGGGSTGSDISSVESSQPSRSRSQPVGSVDDPIVMDLDEHASDEVRATPSPPPAEDHGTTAAAAITTTTTATTTMMQRKKRPRPTELDETGTASVMVQLPTRTAITTQPEEANHDVLDGGGGGSIDETIEKRIVCDTELDDINSPPTKRARVEHGTDSNDHNVSLETMSSTDRAAHENDDAAAIHLPPQERVGEGAFSKDVDDYDDVGVAHTSTPPRHPEMAAATQNSQPQQQQQHPSQWNGGDHTVAASNVTFPTRATTTTESLRLRSHQTPGKINETALRRHHYPYGPVNDESIWTGSTNNNNSISNNNNNNIVVPAYTNPPTTTTATMGVMIQGGGTNNTMDGTMMDRTIRRLHLGLPSRSVPSTTVDVPASSVPISTTAATLIRNGEGTAAALEQQQDISSMILGRHGIPAAAVAALGEAKYKEQVANVAENMVKGGFDKNTIGDDDHDDNHDDDDDDHDHDDFEIDQAHYDNDDDDVLDEVEPHPTLFQSVFGPIVELFSLRLPTTTARAQHEDATIEVNDVAINDHDPVTVVAVAEPIMTDHTSSSSRHGPAVPSSSSSLLLVNSTNNRSWLNYTFFWFVMGLIVHVLYWPYMIHPVLSIVVESSHVTLGLYKQLLQEGRWWLYHNNNDHPLTLLNTTVVVSNDDEDMVEDINNNNNNISVSETSGITEDWVYANASSLLENEMEEEYDEVDFGEEVEEEEEHFDQEEEHEEEEIAEMEIDPSTGDMQSLANNNIQDKMEIVQSKMNELTTLQGNLSIATIMMEAGLEQLLDETTKLSDQLQHRESWEKEMIAQLQRANNAMEDSVDELSIIDSFRSVLGQEWSDQFMLDLTSSSSIFLQWQLPAPKPRCLVGYATRGLVVDALDRWVDAIEQDALELMEDGDLHARLAEWMLIKAEDQARMTLLSPPDHEYIESSKDGHNDVDVDVDDDGEEEKDDDEDVSGVDDIDHDHAVQSSISLQFLLDEMMRTIDKRFELESADQTGQVDYASILNGARIIRGGNRPTSPSLVENLPFLNRLAAAMSLRFYGYGPEAALTPTHPPAALGRCWAFEKDGKARYSAFATLSVRLARPIHVRIISIEHPPREVAKRTNSAIRTFRLLGFEDANAAGKAWNLGSYEYITGSHASIRQDFEITDETAHGVEIPKLASISLLVDSTWGSPLACLYRLRVYGGQDH